MAGRLGLGVVVAAVATAGVVVWFGGDDPDPLEAFCNDAGDELAGLSGSERARAEALGRLGEAAPEELAEVVVAASQAGSGRAVDDMFVVPGDPTSDLKVDVAAEVWHDRVRAGQAWDRVERVLVGDCGLDLVGGMG